MKHIQPITPDEVIKSLPEEVIEAFNELIQENWNGHSATIYQDQAIKRIKEKLKLSGSLISYTSNFLNIESLYREAGWNVDYDKPGYNETYEANFLFKRKI